MGVETFVLREGVAFYLGYAVSQLLVVAQRLKVPLLYDSLISRRLCTVISMYFACELTLLASLYSISAAEERRVKTEETEEGREMREATIRESREKREERKRDERRYEIIEKREKRREERRETREERT